MIGWTGIKSRSTSLMSRPHANKLTIQLSDSGISDNFEYHFLTLDCETLPPTPVLSIEDADLRTFPKSSVVVAAAS